MSQENSYSKKFKDPRWQKKRLKIFERDNWACQMCGSTVNPLVVHHKFYMAWAEPWEYEDKLLITLCDNCHETETESIVPATIEVTQALKRLFFSNNILALGLLISGNIDYFEKKPTANGKYKGRVPISPNKTITRDTFLTWCLQTELTDRQLITFCNEVVPNFIKYLYTPKIEVANGQTN